MDVYCFQRRFPGWTLLLDGGRLLTFWQNSRVGRLFQCGRLLIFAKLCVILEFQCNVILEFECNVFQMLLLIIII